MNTSATAPMHRGPSLLMLGGIYLALFMSGLIISTRMAGGQFYVSPFVSEAAILEFFHLHADAVRVQGFVVFASAIPLGIYAATVVSRLNYLGVRAAGATIALFGGFGASFILALSGMAQWVLSQHNRSASAGKTHCLASMVGYSPSKFPHPQCCVTQSAEPIAPYRENALMIASAIASANPSSMK